MKGFAGIITSSIIIATIAQGCGDGKKGTAEESANMEVVQEEDGNIQLNVSDAYLLSDQEHPERNTVEWMFEASTKGRYEVWLTSFTKDTMDLHYYEPVIVTFEQKRITEKPVGNEIVLDARDIQRPYFRADSRLGSIYIETPGHYNIQLITDKLVAEKSQGSSVVANPFTLVKSLVLKPMKP